MRQAHWTVERLTTAIPRADIILAENQRDGRIADLHPASAAWQEWSDKLKTVASNALIIMGAIPGGSWRHFEAAGSVHRCRGPRNAGSHAVERLATRGSQDRTR